VTEERAEPSGLAGRLSDVRERVASAAGDAGRDPADLTTIVVTKFQPVTMIEELLRLGVRDFGENRHQEAQGKAAELADRDITWHFVGQVQGKKARQVRSYANVVHSVDRDSLATNLGSADSSIDCFIQVNLTEDPARGGIDPAGLDRLVEHVLHTPGLRLLGLMAVAPLEVAPAPAFARVRSLGERIRRLAPEARFLSMGMSQDYPEAIREGATHLRIGTAITGNRPTLG
jgi:pyridoxal phosphate enzyme (YggS family)